MFSRHTAPITFLFAALFAAQYSDACSLGRNPIAYDDALVVLLGRVSAQFEEEVDGRLAFGFVVTPVQIFSQTDERLVSKYKFHPTGLAFDCSSLTVGPSQQIIDYYAIGKLVAIYASPLKSEYPDVFHVTRGHSLELISESCSLESIGKTYDTWLRDGLCGSSYFRAHALVAAIPTAGTQTADESLVNLADYPGGWIRFEELVRQFAIDESREQSLIDLRYGELTYASCLDDFSNQLESSEKRFRRIEFCELSRHEWDTGGD